MAEEPAVEISDPAILATQAAGTQTPAQLPPPPATTPMPPRQGPPAATAPTPPAPSPAAPPDTSTATASLSPPSETEEAPAGLNPHMLGDLPGLFTLQQLAVPGVRTVTVTRTLTQTSSISFPTFTVGSATTALAKPIPGLQTLQVMVPTLLPGTTQVPVTMTVGKVTQTSLVTVPSFTVGMQPVTLQTVPNGTGGLQTQLVAPVGVPTTIQVPFTTTNQFPVRRQVPVVVMTPIHEVVPFAGAFKVAENESPRPEDRVFFTYNFYSDVGLSEGGIGGPRLDLHREVVGFEKTFFGGSTSIGLRAPVTELDGDNGLGGDNFGDVSVLVKYAFYRDRQTGNVLSGGLAVTAPTGPSIPTLAGNLHPSLVQPFWGYIWNLDRQLYVHGFTSVAVPTDSRDVTLLFNDVAVGYTLYRSPSPRLVSAIVPTIEAHLTTPLDHRGAGDLITLPDLLVLTAGAHVDLFRQSTLTFGVATPLTGPRIFDVEAIAQFNWRF
jgi:hypothetical protein